MNINSCIFFVVGLLVTFAYDDISDNKIASQSHIYNDFKASNAVDGNMETCMKTSAIGVGPSFPEKTVWWKVDLGAVYSIYSINIQFKNYDRYVDRQRGRFAGFSLYVSNSDVSFDADIKGSILCYKDSPPVPHLNFTAMCLKQGRYVIYYNERLHGIAYPEGYEFDNVYTELCEVKVKGCNNASVYGSTCDTPCPPNCKDSTCHIQSGACSLCKPGWTGINCNTKCREGWYGVNCSQQCSGHCKDDIHCNHVTGYCERECAAGWTELHCDLECKDGTYGYNCVNNCSGHCLNEFPCNKQTGHCDTGCNPGYIDNKCSKECPPEYFGMYCNELCSGHCINKKPCHHVSGECSNGCKDGYIGSLCTNACKEGYFGTNCSRVCSPNCKPDTCRHTDGKCTSCTAGWTGYNCTTKCMSTYGENCQHPCNELCINRTCDSMNGSCLYGCKYGKQCDEDVEKYFKPASSSNNFPVIVGGTLGACVIVVIGIVFVLFVIRLKRKSTTMAKRQSFILEPKPLRTRELQREQSKLPIDGRSQTVRANDVAESTYALPEKTKRGPPTNKNISVRNMKAQIANMSLNENAGFKSEYHDIPRGELHPCTEGKKPENKVKNRYTTIFPYDHSRVFLKTAAKDEGGYINANFIQASILL